MAALQAQEEAHAGLQSQAEKAVTRLSLTLSALREGENDSDDGEEFARGQESVQQLIAVANSMAEEAVKWRSR